MDSRAPDSRHRRRLPDALRQEGWLIRGHKWRVVSYYTMEKGLVTPYRGTGRLTCRCCGDRFGNLFYVRREALKQFGIHV